MKRWLVAATVVWALVLGAAGYLASRSGPPTAREQTSLAQARANVDRALAEVATAAGPDAVAALSAYAISPGCRITTVRDGTDLTRALRLYTPVGGERALLERLAAALPTTFRARVPRPVASASPVLRADAGDFVKLRGEVAGPGELRIAADAGCRSGRDLGTPSAGPAPTPAERATVDDVLRALDVREPRWQAYQVPCPGGGAVRTVEAVGPGVAGPLPAALQAVRGSSAAVLTEPQRYAYRTGSTAIAVRAQDDLITVTATSSCPGS